MICSLDKSKIHNAIQEKITSTLNDSPSFINDGEVYIGKSDTWKNEAEKLNNSFKGEVVKILSHGVKVNISDAVVNRYIFSQPDSSVQIQEALREQYLKQFSSSGLNLSMGDFWLNHPILENPTVEKLFAFAKKINPNFKIGILEGKNEQSLALIRDYIIGVREDLFIDELPEEISHFFVELLPEDSELFQNMMKDILNYPIYGETYESHKNDPVYQINGKPNIEKIKKEAIAKLVSEYISAAFNETADEKYKNKRSKISEFVHKFMKFIRKAFYKLSGNLYHEPVLTNNDFEKSAGMILEGDTSMLDLKKIASPYDTVFFSKIEENKKESFEVTTIAKQLHALGRELKISVKKEFFTFLDRENLIGLKEALSDGNYNRVWDAINLLTEAQSDFGFLSDSVNGEVSKLAEACHKMSEAYRELNQIPESIEKILIDLKQSKSQGKLSEEVLVNKIKEIQAYLKLSDSFKSLSKKFTSMIKYVREKEIDKKESLKGFKGTADTMIADMGSTIHKFNVVDQQIFDILREYLADLTFNLASDAFDNFLEETQTLKEKIENRKENERRKNQFIKDVQENFTSREQLMWALTGDFTGLENVIAENKDKIKIKGDKLKDITNANYLLYMAGATTTVDDPFIANVMVMYIDKLLQAKTKSLNEQISFAKRITPILNKLKALGSGYYTSQKEIIETQKFFDRQEEGNVFERKTLMYAVKSFEFQYEKQALLEKIKKLKQDRNSLHIKLNNLNNSTEPNQSEISELSAKIAESDKLVKEAEEEFNNFINTFSNREYTDEFYQKIELLKDDSVDSLQLKELKSVQRQINNLMNDIDEMIVHDIPFDTPALVQKINELAVKQRRKLEIKQNMFPDKEKFEKYEELFEENKEATDQVVTRHKRAFIKNFINRNIAMITNPIYEKNPTTIQDLEKSAIGFYNQLFKITVPNQKFWDERASILDTIVALSGRTDRTIVMAERLKELHERKSKILSDIRNLRQEASIYAIQNDSYPGSYVTDEKGDVILDTNGNPVPKLIHEELAEIENEIELLRAKIKVMQNYEMVARIGKEMTPELDQSLNVVAATIDVIYAFKSLMYSQFPIVDIKKKLGNYFEINELIAKEIKSHFDSLNEDNGEEVFSNIVKLLKPKDNVGQILLENMFVDVKGFPAMEVFESFIIERLSKHYSSLYRETKPLREEINKLWRDLDELQSKDVSSDYIFGPFLLMRNIVQEISELDENDPLYTAIDVDMLVKKALAMNNMNKDAKEVEKLLSGGFFTEIIRYLTLKSQTPNDVDSEALAKFLANIHEIKENFEGEITIKPRNFLTLFNPAKDEHAEERVPNFLKRKKVRDEFRIEKKNMLHPDVVAGISVPNVDLNGEWLPKVAKQVKDAKGNMIINPFWNTEYERLQSSGDDRDKLKFQMLKEFTKFYLERQMLLEEGERLDLVLPARMVDEYENMILHINGLQEWAKNVKEWFKPKAETSQNLNEELGIVTKENKEIYTGRDIATHAVKLDSRRKIPVQRVSDDVLASMLFFIQDTNTYEAKNHVAPLFKSFADVFKEAYSKNENANKVRAQIFNDLLNTKIYGIAPDNFANNPYLARFLKIANLLAVNKLLGDPLGAMVNLFSGELNNLIEANVNPSEWKNWLSTGHIASHWAMIVSKDTYTKEEISKENQFANAFAFFPQETNISNRMSTAAVATDVRQTLMIPRSLTELEVGIHLGLSILRSIPIVDNPNKEIAKEMTKEDGSKYNFEDLYEIDKKTGLIDLIPRFKNNEVLNSMYNLKDGTEVVKARRKVVQKYTLIQGNFYDFNQDYISNTALGRSIELMKRWFVTGYTRRFQGRRIDFMLETDTIGYHRAMLNLMKEFFLSLYQTRNLDQFMTYWVSTRKSDSIGHKRAMAEIFWIALFGMLIIPVLLGFDDDDKDRNKKLKEMSYWQQVFLLIAMRVSSELGTFIPLPVWGLGLNETKRALLDPISTIRGPIDSLVATGAMAIYQLQYALGINDEDLERQLYYQKDATGETKGSSFFGAVDNKTLYLKDKGDSKILATILNAIGYTGNTFKPEAYIKVLNQMSNRLK